MGSITNGNEPIKAIEQDDLVMPIIDFSTFTDGSVEQRLATAQQILHAFKNSGFLYLSNHPISPSTVSSAFALSAKFFARPDEQKDALAWTSPEANRGYVTAGREKNTDLTDAKEVAKLREHLPDLKESMEIGREGEEGRPNNWPDRFDSDGVEFTEFMKDFHKQLSHLHREVMRAIGVGLMGLGGQQYFDSFTTVDDNTLRLLHYPAVKKTVFKHNPNQVRTGAHSDYGSITLLFQDDVGGLQVKSPRGTWVRAIPVPDTIVVNAGDLLARWSNDLIVSTKHRVIQPPPKQGEIDDLPDDSEEMYPARYSIAFFCNPSFHKFIEALPGTFGGDLGEKKYEGINSGDYFTTTCSYILMMPIPSGKGVEIAMIVIEACEKRSGYPDYNKTKKLNYSLKKLKVVEN